MDQTDECCSFRLIDGKGTFDVAGIKTFEKKVKLEGSGLPYTTVSIMGPQSSGKSTLLNHLFGTNFREMDSLNERGQTTQGIWLAKCPGIKPCTLVMDLEGFDGRERGEDDIAFEKQAALFAFCVSDIVLINMWCHDVGRVQAAIQPLLRSVLEAMGKLFSYHKTTLWFVLRDKSRTPNKILEELLRNDLQQIWDSLANRQADEGTLLSENFNVKITALTSYEDMEEQFKEEVVGLRQQLFSSVTYGGFTREGRGIVPASGFSFSVEEIWETIKESKDLNIPPQRIMEAIVLCEDIAKEKHASFITNEYWCQLEKDVQSHPVQDFGKKINPILNSYLLEYDLDAKYFDEGVRTEKRKQLKDRLLQIVKPTWESMLEHIHNGNLDKFKEALREKLRGGGGKFSVDACDCASSIIGQFDKECLAAIIEQASWDSSKFRDKLQKDIDAHVAVVRLSMLSKVLSEHEENLKAALSGPVETLLVRAGDDMWKEIRIVLGDKTKSCFMKFSTALSGFEEDEQTKNRRLKELMDYARGMIQAKARQNAGRVLTYMKDRFERFFIHDSNSNLRVWNGEEDIAAIRQTARSASLKLLCIMAAIRLDEDADDIEKTLFCAFLDSNASPELPVAVASDTWEKVPQLNTLITPVKCKEIWSQFNEFSETVVIKAQENVATIHCAAIVNKKLASFIANKDWHKLQKELRFQPVPDFWKKLSLIIDTCLSAYDVETRKFGGVRTEKRRELKEKILQQACLSMFEHIHSRTLDAFKEAFSEKLGGGEEFYVAAHDSTMSSIVKFDEECSVETIENANCESSEFRDKLQHDIDVHIAAVHSSMLSTLSTQYQEKLKKLLQGVISGDNTWHEESKIYAIQSSFNDFSAALSNSKVDEQTKHKMLENLEDYARGLIQAKARQKAITVLMDVKDRFERFISDDINSKLRVWSSKEDDLAIRETAHSASLKLHSIMATIRVDDDADDIDKILFSALMDNYVSTKISGRLGPDSKGKVPSRDKWQKPVSVKDCWSQFNDFSKAIVIQAQVKVATVRCEAISCKKLISFIANENWCQLKQDVQSRPVPDFGKKLNLILHTCLSEYDGETGYFDEGVRTEKRRQLRDGLLLLVRPTCESMFEYVFAGTLEKFKRALDEKLEGEEFIVAARYCTKSFMTQFDEGCRDAIIDKEQWDSLKLRGKLQREFDKYVAAVGHSKQSALLSPY